MQAPQNKSIHFLRQIMAWYPNKRLYKRSSALSGKPLVTTYPPETDCPVYSHEEWYAERAEAPALELQMDQAFFPQFQKLQTLAPVVALLSTQQENAEYCQDVEQLKNSYMVWDAIKGEDLLYCTRIYNSRSCVDCYWAMDSELLYDCTYVFSSYNSRYSFHCKQITDSAFLYDCRNSQNCFMSYGLRNQEYCIYNQAYTKEQYEDFMATIDLENLEKVRELKEYFLREIVQAHPAETIENCESSTGQWLKECKNVENGFESFEVRDGRNILQCAKGADIYDSFMCNDRVEQCYQCVATGIASQNVRNCAFVWHSSNMEYSYLCLNSQNCFGCIGLRNKSYHILNRAYSKEEYEAIVPELIKRMTERGEYPNFFPIELSPFRYEDTIAADFFDSKPQSSFAEEKVTYNSQELRFYAAHRIAKPELPFTLRYQERMNLMRTVLF